MMTERRSGILTLVFSLSLLCVFAASALLVAILGARVYKSTSANMTANYNVRTSVSYIAEKVRQGDEAGAVAAVSFGDGDALALRRTIDGTEYTTYIYTSGGSLREIFARSDAAPDPATGQALMPVESFTATLSDGLLSVTVRDGSGETAQVSLHPRCGA